MALRWSHQLPVLSALINGLTINTKLNAKHSFPVLDFSLSAFSSDMCSWSVWRCALSEKELADISLVIIMTLMRTVRYYTLHWLRQVRQSLMLSSQALCCLPLCRLHSTVPWRIVLEKDLWRDMYHIYACELVPLYRWTPSNGSCQCLQGWCRTDCLT